MITLEETLFILANDHSLFLNCIVVKTEKKFFQGSMNKKRVLLRRLLFLSVCERVLRSQYLDTDRKSGDHSLSIKTLTYS